jgi:hypothetical protein
MHTLACCGDDDKQQLDFVVLPEYHLHVHRGRSVLND